MKVLQILSLLGAGLALSACTSGVAADRNVPEGKSPPVTRVVSVERNLLSCYSQEKWATNGPINIAVRKIRDETGKASYGDYGEGTVFPNDNITMGLATLQLAAMGNSPIKVYPRGKDYMDTIAAEGSTRLRDNSTVQVANASYYYNASVSGADSIAAWVAQVAVGPVGGGPSEQRYKVTMDIVLEDWKYGNVVYAASVEKQFVQQELKAMFSKIMPLFNGDRQLVAAQVESVSRSMMQGIVRKLIEGGSFELLRQLPGSPAKCNNNVNTYFAATAIRPVS